MLATAEAAPCSRVPSRAKLSNSDWMYTHVIGFEVASAGGPAAGARLEIVETPLIVHCAVCDADLTVDDPTLLRCPRCEGAVTVVSLIRLPSAESRYRKVTRPSSQPTRRSFEIATRWVYRDRYSRVCCGPPKGGLQYTTHSCS